MKSQLIKKHLLEEVIYFESEDLNYFEPFSSDLKTIEYDPDSDNSWSTMDPATSDKPMTIVIDIEANPEDGTYSGRVKGVYLFDININELKTFEGDHGYSEENMEYYAFETPVEGLIIHEEDAIEDDNYRYADNFKDRILDLICD